MTWPTYTHHFVLWIDGKPRQLHTFDTTYGMPKWYWTIVSMNSFANREGERLMKHGIKVHKRVHVDRDYHLRRTTSSYGEALHMKLEHHHHSDLWSLYQAIGYDRKKKRYIA